jgi:hypothetical protein
MGRPRNPHTVHHLFRGVSISLYRKKRGDWEAGFTIMGQGRCKATGADERQCREAACAKIREALGPDEIAARSDEAKARELLEPSGVTLTEAARFFLSEHLKPEFPGTVSQVRERWLQKIKQKKGKSRYHHYRSSAQRTAYLEERFGDRQISTISLAELTNFQDEMEVTRAGRTVRNIHDAMKALFVYARKRGYLLSDRLSVAERLDRPTAAAGKKGIFNTEEMQRLVDTAWGHAMPGALPLVAVGFGSTRSEEPCKQDPDQPMQHRIWWQDIIWSEDYIDIRPEVAKTGVARRAGLPANLKAMLMPLRGSGPLYAGKRLDLAFAAIAAKAGVDWKSNGLRHSCITADMLLAPNATEVANRSGNSVTVIEKCYRNTKATRAQAVEWFSIQPRVAWGSLLPGYSGPK